LNFENFKNKIMAEENKKNEEIIEGPHGKIWAYWSFPEYVKAKRSKNWYFFTTIIVLALLTYAILTTNFLFALIIILGVTILIISGKREPKEVDFKITEDGLEVDKDFYPYKDIKHFWIVYEPPEVKTLFIVFRNMLKPRLSIPLEDQDPVKIRKILLQYIEENLEKEDEPISDYLKRTLKL